MKNLSKSILYFTLASLFFVQKALALDFGQADGVRKTADTAGYAPNTTDTTLAETIGVVIKVALSFVGVLFMALIFYAGYLWMTARGDDAQIDKAKKIISSAIIGIIITVGAYSITVFFAT